MPRPRRDTRRQAADALAGVVPVVSRFVERLLAAHEPPLTLPQYLALRAVAEGDIGGADLARQASVSPAAVSQLLSTLEGAGLVERARILEDRRRHTLTLTDAGDRTVRSVEALLREQLALLLSDLPEPEADALAHALDRLDALLRGKVPPPRPRRPGPPGPKRPGPPRD
jgi:DNA-binding MarR family transcriptional regulator